MNVSTKATAKAISMLKPLYKMVHYKTIYGDFSIHFLHNQEFTDYIDKRPFMVIFLYYLYVFVWIKHGCLANKVFGLDSKQVLMYYLSLS